jgi:hypothetical protein
LFRIMMLSGEIRNFRLFADLAPGAGHDLLCRQSEVQETGAGRRCAKLALAERPKKASRKLPGLAVSAAITKVGARQASCGDETSASGVGHALCNRDLPRHRLPDLGRRLQ